MKVSSLKTMVGLAAPFLIDQDFIPILQHFWFRPNSIMAYNDIQAVRLMLDTGLNCAVPGKLLGKLLGTISHEEIDLKLNQFGTELLIGYGKNQDNYQHYPLMNLYLKCQTLRESQLL